MRRFGVLTQFSARQLKQTGTLETTDASPRVDDEIPGVKMVKPAPTQPLSDDEGMIFCSNVFGMNVAQYCDDVDATIIWFLSRVNLVAICLNFMGGSISTLPRHILAIFCVAHY